MCQRIFKRNLVVGMPRKRSKDKFGTSQGHPGTFGPIFCGRARISAGHTGHMTGQMGHVHWIDGTHAKGCPAKILYVYCFLSFPMTCDSLTSNYFNMSSAFPEILCSNEVFLHKGFMLVTTSRRAAVRETSAKSPPPSLQLTETICCAFPKKERIG